jgi:hypothetical protein
MKTILIFILIVLFEDTLSQEPSYHNYYNMIHKAESLNFSEEYKKSFSQYIKAFKTNYPFHKDLYKAYQISTTLLDLGDSSIINERELIVELQETFFTKDLYVRTFVDESKKKKLMAFFPYLSSADFLRPSQEIIKHTANLSNYLFADQTIRRSLKRGIVFKDDMLRKIDSILYTNLVAYLLRNGLPDRKLTGKYYQNMHVILLHGSYHLGITSELKEVLISNLFSGNYHPSNYAFLIDKYNTWNLKQPQTYGQFCTENYELKNFIYIKEVDQRRKQIGLEPLKKYAENNYLTLSLD